MIIDTKPIEKAVAFLTCYRVENAVREWERETIRDRRVELPVIDADSDFLIFLGDDYDWA